MTAPSPTYFYTDLITSDAKDYLEWFHAATKGHPLTVVTGDSSGVPFDSPCSALAQIRRDLKGYGSPGSADEWPPPRAICLSFYGGTGSVCAGGLPTTDPAYLAKCVDTFNKIDAAAAYMGVPVYWASPPQHPPAAPNPLIGDSLNSAALLLGWNCIEAGAACGTPVGPWIYDWVDSLPCLPDETLADGCVAGVIDIRGADEDTFSFAGNGYSGGARRWAEAAVAGMPEYDAVPCESTESWMVGCLPFYDGPENPISLASGRVALIGDSITAYAESDIRTAFADRLLTMRGIPGCDLVDGWRRLVTEAVYAEPVVIMIELGVNTALYDWDAGDVTILEGMLTNMADILSVIWITVTCEEPSWYDHLGTGTLHDRIEDFKAALAAEVGSFPNLSIADFGAEQVLHPEWWTDGLHMNDDGNAAYAAFLRALVM